MDVPTAAAKNDEHFSKKSVCQLDFSCPKVFELLRGNFLLQKLKKQKRFDFESVSQM